MKKLLILFTVILISCGPSKEEIRKFEKENPTINPVTMEPYRDTPAKNAFPQDMEILIIDSCEYIYHYGNHSESLIHKQNCKNHRSTSYQFQITDQDHALLYDGDKLIGRFKFTNTALDSLITKDNQ